MKVKITIALLAAPIHVEGLGVSFAIGALDMEDESVLCIHG